MQLRPWLCRTCSETADRRPCWHSKKMAGWTGALDTWRFMAFSPFIERQISAPSMRKTGSETGVDVGFSFVPLDSFWREECLSVCPSWAATAFSTLRPEKTPHTLYAVSREKAKACLEKPEMAVVTVKMAETRGGAGLTVAERKRPYSEEICPSWTWPSRHKACFSP